MGGRAVPAPNLVPEVGIPRRKKHLGFASLRSPKPSQETNPRGNRDIGLPSSWGSLTSGLWFGARGVWAWVRQDLRQPSPETAPWAAA